MQVYFARSIRGGHKSGERIFFQAIVDTIKECGHVPALEVRPITRSYEDTNQYIYERDLKWIDDSQAMIAEVSNPSLGVGYEIAYAKHIRKIPILALAYKDTNVSAMIQGCMKVQYYRDRSDMTDMIRTFLVGIADPKGYMRPCEACLGGGTMRDGDYVLHCDVCGGTGIYTEDKEDSETIG